MYVLREFSRTLAKRINFNQEARSFADISNVTHLAHTHTALDTNKEARMGAEKPPPVLAAINSRQSALFGISLNQATEAATSR